MHTYRFWPCGSPRHVCIADASCSLALTHRSNGLAFLPWAMSCQQRPCANWSRRLKPTWMSKNCVGFGCHGVATLVAYGLAMAANSRLPRLREGSAASNDSSSALRPGHTYGMCSQPSAARRRFCSRLRSSSGCLAAWRQSVSLNSAAGLSLESSWCVEWATFELGLQQLYWWLRWHRLW